jgi:hypothetical protein
MVSAADLAILPGIEELTKLTQAMALLDACFEPEWQYRYYSFNATWSPRQRLASMRNGAGDSWICVFAAEGALFKGFDHESIMSPWQTGAVWPNVIDQVPPALKPILAEPAFPLNDTTFCIWRCPGDARWHVGDIAYPDGDDPDGAGWMLSMLDGSPRTYQNWAKDYYERPVDLSAVRHVYEHRPLTPEIARTLNPTIDFAALQRDIAEIGYPMA